VQGPQVAYSGERAKELIPLLIEQLRDDEPAAGEILQRVEWAGGEAAWIELTQKVFYAL
jgi:hypothetical protein